MNQMNEMAINYFSIPEAEMVFDFDFFAIYLIHNINTLTQIFLLDV